MVGWGCHDGQSKTCAPRGCMVDISTVVKVSGPQKIKLLPHWAARGEGYLAIGS